MMFLFNWVLVTFHANFQGVSTRPFTTFRKPGTGTESVDFSRGKNTRPLAAWLRSSVLGHTAPVTRDQKSVG